MMKHIFPIVILSGLVAGLSSCDKIETVDLSRTVVITTNHPPTPTYHFELGLNGPGNVVMWDTTSEISQTISAQAGDAIYYAMSTTVMGAQLHIAVDGIEKLSLDLTGSESNTASGYILLD